MMKNNYEKSAQQAAVDAVEARWARNNAAARKVAHVKSFKSFIAWIVLIGILVVGGMPCHI